MRHVTEAWGTEPKGNGGRLGPQNVSCAAPASFLQGLRGGESHRQKQPKPPGHCLEKSCPREPRPGHVEERSEFLLCKMAHAGCFSQEVASPSSFSGESGGPLDVFCPFSRPFEEADLFSLLSYPKLHYFFSLLIQSQ